MLCNFKALHKVEVSAEVKWLAQVADDEMLLRDLKPIHINIVAVNSRDIADPELAPYREPRALTAADVQDTFDFHICQQRQESFRGP